MAVDPASGRNMWSFDSGLPLVSASNFQPDRSIFPGADGILYVYKADYDNKQGVEVSLELLWNLTMVVLLAAAWSITCMANEHKVAMHIT